MENEDGSYTIILNSRLSYEQNVKSFKHELRHICNNDFSKDVIEVNEYDTHFERREVLRWLRKNK